MFNIGMTEMIIIGAIALLVIGPKGLPGVARTIGKALTTFRRTTNDFKRTIHAEFDQHVGPDTQELSKLAREIRSQVKNPGDIADALETAAQVIERGQQELGQVAQPLSQTPEVQDKPSPKDT